MNKVAYFGIFMVTPHLFGAERRHEYDASPGHEGYAVNGFRQLVPDTVMFRRFRR
jgi:hypothetical protein